MTITRYRNDHRLDHQIPKTFSEMLDTFFDNAVSPSQALQNRSFQPRVDISEHDNSFEIGVALPGLKKEDVSIQLEDNVLTISGEREYKTEEGSENKKYHLVETSYGSFTRSFTLPRNIDRESISAQMEDGILKVSIAKNEEAVSRKIDIS